MHDTDYELIIKRDGLWDASNVTLLANLEVAYLELQELG